MIRHRLAAVVLLSILRSAAFAQGTNATNVPFQWYLHTYPAQLIDIASRPMAMFGAEYLLSEKWSVLAAGGVKIGEPYASATDTVWTIARGYGTRLGVKRYLEGHAVRRGWYASIEYRWIHEQGTQQVWYVDSMARDTAGLRAPRVEDYFGFVQDIHVIDLKCGRTWHRGRFMLDVYMGLGIRFKDVRNTNIEFGEYPNMILDEPRHPNVDNIRRKNRIAALADPVMPNIALGLRLGWWL